MGHVARRADQARRTRPVIVALVAGLMAVASVSDLRVSTAQAQDSDPFLSEIEAAAQARAERIQVTGTRKKVTDAPNDQLGIKDPVADIVEADIYSMETVPDYLLEGDGLFGCGPAVCSEDGVANPEAFDTGAWLVIIHVGAQIPGTVAGLRYEWGAFFQLERFPTTPVAPGNLTGGYSHLIVMRQDGDMRGMFEYGIGTGTFEPFKTRTRTLVMDDIVVLMTPKRMDLPTAALGMGVYAFASDSTPAGTGRDVLGNIGDPPITVADAPVLSFAKVAETPVVTEAPTPASSSAPISTPPRVTPAPTQGGSTPGGGTDGGFPWPVLILAGLVIAAVGGWLLLRGRGGADRAPGPAMIVATPSGDPCPPLIEAARRARAACEEALKAAAAAADRAREAAAEVAAKLSALEDARKARQAAEQELERRQKEPDRSSWMSSGGRYEDSYDLKLKADARAAANAAHADAVKNAGSDAERGQAHRDWQEQLDHIDSQEGLDELRRNDREGREQWAREAEEALEAAREAEAAAQAAFDAASEASREAAKAAAEARSKADAACDQARAAEQAAVDAGCMPGATPPAAAGEAPRPDKPEEPKPDEPDKPTGPTPGPTPPTGGGGGTPPKPEEPKPDKPTPPVGGGGSGGETPSRPRQCDDGAQEWRRETQPVGAFLVPAPGGKILISSSPSFEKLDEYLQGWKGYDSNSRPDPDAGPGVPPGAFRRADASRWTQLFGNVERKAMKVTIHVTLPLQLVRTHCERLYECRDGAWVRTDRCRAVEHEPEPKPKVNKFESDGARRNEIVTFMQRCVNDWVKAEEQAHELATFSSKCCT